MKRFVLVGHTQRAAASLEIFNAPDGTHVTIGESARTLDQNAAQWPILEAFARQLRWPVNGHMVELEADDWKDILTAAFERESRVAEGLNGGHVLLGQRTRQYSKAKFSEWLEFLHSVAAERGVEL